MRDFLVPSEEIFFSSCNGCVDCCTNYPFAPIFLDEFESASKHFPIVFAEIGDAKFALVLLFDDTNRCRYLKDNRCTNYDNRASACKIYPIMPIDGEIYLDVSCKALNYNDGKKLIENDKIADHFWHERLENFETKKSKTQTFLSSIWGELNYYKTFKGVDVLSCNKSSNNEFLKYHQSSLLLQTC